MDFNELKGLQEKFDRQHGWNLRSDKLPDLFDFLHKDLVGLLGEIGEFANIVKKFTLEYSTFHISESKKLFEQSKKKLAEELVDTLIYVMRMATHLNIDIEKEYLTKLDINRKKFRKYEIEDSQSTKGL